MQVRNSNSSWFGLSGQVRSMTGNVVLLAIVIGAPAIAAAQAGNGPFAKSIAYAQARTVKIYGAGIGRQEGYATGIIISADGRILTTQGVFLAGGSIRVVLPNGDKHYALVERRSHPLNAAILKLDSPPEVEAIQTPDYFEVAETSVAQKGDWVIGISNAFKVANGSERLSVTLGVVSLRTQLEAKRGASDVDYDQDVLLIDCITSNPGAPGGAVVTADGRLAGMIGKVIESKSTQTRLNYAVPNDLLHKFLIGEPIKITTPKTLTGGKAVLGIRLFTLGGRRAPAYIDRVKPGSPAAKAGLRSDDLILSIGGERIRYASEYKKILAQLTPGKPVTIIVKRKAKAVTVQVTPEAEDK